MSDPRYASGQVVDGRAICGAKTRSGKPCMQRPVTDRTRCRMHGGASPRGLAHPSTTHGRFSKDLPTRLLADYEAARTDPDLVAVREELAVLAARELDLMRTVDSGESGQLWATLRAGWEQYEKAVAARDADAMGAALRTIGATIERGASDRAVWNELRDTMEARRRLAETERRRLVDLRQMITSERAMLLMTGLVASVQRHIEDRDALARIDADFRRLFSAGDAPAGSRERGSE